jgi:3-oxoacyl-[acyl-carrier protein] reductase
MDLNLKNKVVVITGGATGIGKATALEFLREGCRVAICGRRQEKLDEAKSFFREQGFNIISETCDATDYESLFSFAKTVYDTWGSIDIWVNNAGGNQIKSLTDYSTDEFRYIIDLNLTTVFNGCKTAWQFMKNRGGVILNAASFAAIAPSAGRAPYSAAKAGVVSLTRTFAAEFAKDQIRVLAYIPGMIKTDMSRASIERYPELLIRDIPMKRFGEPEDLAKVLVFISSDAAGYMNGTAVEISGGKRCVQNPQYSYE